MGSGYSKQKKQSRLMQEQFVRLQEELKSKEATGSAGHGLVTISLNANHEILKLSIKKECVDPEDVEGLEDLIKEAYRQANEQLQESMPKIPGFSL